MPDTISRYWPSRINVNDCIRTEAEAVSEAVFLAVHQPVELLKRRCDRPQESKKVSEKEFLDAFLTEDLPVGTLLIPILGSSGIGKSHMIRWLDIQLRRRSDSNKRHIIRIPKSASLKSVLTLILENLEGKEYDQIRKELVSARENINSDDASQHLRTYLLISLERVSIEAANRVQTARQQGLQPSAEDRKIVAHASPKGLPALLNDPEFAEHFMGVMSSQDGVLHKIADRAINGGISDSDILNQFSVTDLDIINDVIVKRAAHTTVNYCRQLQAVTRKQEAVDVLNGVLDKAIYQLLALGDNQLADLFVRIRKLLFSEGLELVLLVEDFAALAGIQGALLDAMITTAHKDGRQELCTMRTALAVTEGYLINRDTVQTRTQFEYVIEDVPSDDEGQIIQSIVDMVASYMNAARLGEKELEKFYTSIVDADIFSKSLRFEDYLKLEPDDQDILTAFGTDRNGYSLFPFNYSAVRQMAKKQFRNPNDEVVFKPREVINKILRPVLLDNREYLDKSAFPPGNFLGYTVSEIDPYVQDHVKTLVKNEEHRRRYLALIRFWGDNPRSVESIYLDGKICQAFGLAPFQSSEIEPPPAKRDQPQTHIRKPAHTPEIVKRSEEVEPHSAKIDHWKDVLTAWSQGKDIPFAEANQLRGYISAGVNNFIDWDTELLKPLKLSDTYYRKWVYIPGARGGEQAATEKTAMVSVCLDDDWKDHSKSLNTVLTLMAVVRFFENDKNWNYDGCEKDYALYANFMNKISRQAIEFCRRRYFKQDFNLAPALTQSLLVSSRILGLDDGTQDDIPSLIKSVFELPKPEQVDAARSSGQVSLKWMELATLCSNVHSDFRDSLLQLVGARQGGAEKVHAIDVDQLLESIIQIRKNWNINSTPPPSKSVGDYEKIRRPIVEIAGRFNSAKDDKLGEIRRWKDLLTKSFGASPFKPDVVDLLEKTLNTANNLSLVKDVNAAEGLREKLHVLNHPDSNVLMETVKSLNSTKETGKILSLLARVDDRLIIKIRDAVESLKAFFDDTSDRLNLRIMSSANLEMLNQTTAEIDYQLSLLESKIQKYNSLRRLK